MACVRAGGRADVQVFEGGAGLGCLMWRGLGGWVEGRIPRWAACFYPGVHPHPRHIACILSPHGFQTLAGERLNFLIYTEPRALTGLRLI